MASPRPYRALTDPFVKLACLALAVACHSESDSVERRHVMKFLAATFPGNGQLSLIFGVPNFCVFSLLVLCLFKLQVEAKKRKN